MNSNNKNKSGIGLIEVIISISVLGIGILGLLQAFPRGTSVERDIELTTIGHHLAQEKIEEIVSLNYGEIAIGIIENQVRVDTDPTSDFYDFLRTTEVWLLDQNLIVSGSDIGLKKIRVTIEWISVFGGPNRDTSITTMISEK